MKALSRKADRVADDLLRRIVAGELSPGSILPREDALAEEYGVNRGVVREAIKQLEVHRLVRPVRRRGTEVLDPVASLSPEVLRAMIAPHPGRVDLAMLRSLLEIREHLDLQLVRLVGERATEDDFEALEAIVAQMARVVDDPTRFHGLADRFSQRLAAATRNVIFVMMVHWNQSVVADLRSVLLAGRPVSGNFVAGLQVLLGLLRARRVDDALSLTSGFHGWARPRILAAAALASGQSLSDATSAAAADDATVPTGAPR